MLDARVVGDDAEEYGDEGTVVQSELASENVVIVSAYWKPVGFLALVLFVIGIYLAKFTTPVWLKLVGLIFMGTSVFAFRLLFGPRKGPHF